MTTKKVREESALDENHYLKILLCIFKESSYEKIKLLWISYLLRVLPSDYYTVRSQIYDMKGDVTTLTSILLKGAPSVYVYRYCHQCKQYARNKELSTFTVHFLSDNLDNLETALVQKIKKSYRNSKCVNCHSRHEITLEFLYMLFINPMKQGIGEKFGNLTLKDIPHRLTLDGKTYNFTFLIHYEDSESDAVVSHYKCYFFTGLEYIEIDDLKAQNKATLSDKNILVKPSLIVYTQSNYTE